MLVKSFPNCLARERLLYATLFPPAVEVVPQAPWLFTALLLVSIILFWLLSRLWAPYWASTGGCEAGAAEITDALLGMRAKWPFLAELSPPRLDCFVECIPTPLVLLLVAFYFDPPPDINPVWTTVIELELGAPHPRDAGPTLLVWAVLRTVLPPGPNMRWSKGLRFSCPVA